MAAISPQVQIGCEEFSVAILPEAGGKIASIRFAHSELLQQPLTIDFTRSRTMLFDESDASGWDECLPSVAPCELSTAAGRALVPDHGDLWRIPWEVLRSSASTCAMRARCFSLPLELSRVVTVEQIGSGYSIRLDYVLRNTGSSPAPWAWSAHPLFAALSGDHIVLPESVQSLRVEYSCGGRLTGIVKWPIAGPSQKLATDLSIVQAPDSEVANKLFAGPLKSTENWCSLERYSAGVRIRVNFDPAATPFLGLWLCYGGWPAAPGPRQMCVALEPSTSPVDSLASSEKWKRILEPGASFSWTMTAEFHRM